jgi:hypothetical protein
MRAFALVFACVTCLAVCRADELAAVTGLVTDPNGRSVPGVTVYITNLATNVGSRTITNDQGVYRIPSLQPGIYRITLDKDGFKSIVKSGVELHVQDVASINFELQIGSVSETVTVEAGGLVINTTDASVSTVVNRQFVENMPLNGRSFQSLLLLTPGVTAVPGASTNATGEFSVNGQRTEANYYMVDGVSANTGMLGLGYFGQTPAETALGTTQSLVSVDGLEEFRVNTSTYSAEYGRTPGGQISIQTRSGTNIWHGSVFDYFRNDALDSNNWFNNAAGLPKAAEKQNDFGGTLGGPVKLPGYNGRDKTFFFFSYEGLRLTVPHPALSTDVPDTALRQDSPASVQPLLNLFPIQNGPEHGNGMALFTASYSSPSSLDTYSLRIDHNFGDKLRLFGRYADTPSNSVTRNAPQNFANVITTTSDIKTATIGAASVFSSWLSNELRFNYTSNFNDQRNSLDGFGGAVPLSLSQAFSGATVPRYYFFQELLGFGTNPVTRLFYSANPSHQWNVTDSLASSLGHHALKFGVDYRRQTGTNGFGQLLNSFTYSSPSDFISNAASSGYVQTVGAVPATGSFTNFSAFVQDEWTKTSRLHLSFGLRWDLNPPPHAAPQPYVLDQITDLATAQLSAKGTPLYHTDYRGFAPRIGVAYQIHQSPGYETVFRSGFGVFYDLGNSYALGAVVNGGVGIGTSVSYSSLSYPLSPAQQTLPAPSIAAPYTGVVYTFDPHLKLPYTLEWNAAVEQRLGSNQALTVSYVAAGGRKLLQAQALIPNLPDYVLGSGVVITTNSSASSYNSLQVQFQRHLSHGLQVLASYTWSHAIDNLSSNQNQIAPLRRGNADFDVRHIFSAALTYDVPGSYRNAVAGALLKNWSIDLRQTARSGLPVQIFSGYEILPDGAFVSAWPDMVPGVSIYLRDPTAPGGRVVNLNAFTASTGANGNEPRNFVRGFAAWQTDLAIRRQFSLRERLKLQFRAESFNLFNHPNFGSIYNFTTDGPTLFGRANSTLNNSLGGLNPLYQMGGPRSLQLALKVVF